MLCCLTCRLLLLAFVSCVVGECRRYMGVVRLWLLVSREASAGVRVRVRVWRRERGRVCAFVSEREGVSVCVCMYIYLRVFVSLWLFNVGLPQCFTVRY